MPSAEMPGEEGRSRTRIVARILIVEDEARIASFLGHALTSCGFEVEWANDGAAALKKLTQVSYDLVLLDLLLPGVDGFSVLRELAGVRPDQQVLVLSALSDVESKVRCFELGASDYLTKPFSIAELVARVRARVQHATDRVDARFLEQGGLKLDLRRRVAHSNGKLVNLSTREFLLLEYLMRKEGDVCTRQELLAAVWGYTFDPGTNVVDVYVRRLRTKVGRETIETIRNVGYSYAVAA
jgi:DNA-binding response OmpR family regulator